MHLQGQQLGRFHNEDDQVNLLDCAIISEESEETSSSEDAEPNYLAPFAPLLTIRPVHGKSLSGRAHKWLIVLLCLHLNCRII